MRRYTACTNAPRAARFSPCDCILSPAVSTSESQYGAVGRAGEVWRCSIVCCVNSYAPIHRATLARLMRVRLEVEQGRESGRTGDFSF